MSNLEGPGESGEPQGGASWRVWLRIILGLYLVTLPACTQDAGHFGPGFFPFLAALFLVPIFALITFLDAAYAWVEVADAEGRGKKILLAAVMSFVSVGYWGLIVYAIVEKSST